MLRTLLYVLLLFALSFLFSQCKQEEHVTVCFTGDVLLDRGVRLQIENKGIAHLFDSVAPVLQSADATIINLECPVTSSISPIHKKFIFRAEPEWLPAIHKAGVTHAALANNHSLDQGYQGLEDTNQHLTANRIIPIGYGDTQCLACQPTFIRKKGIEIALFNSVLLPLENWVYLEDKNGICQATVDALVEEIQTLKKEKPDCYIVAMLHWGVEYQQLPTPFQRREAHRLINAGTDLIIGHHPHVIQEEEFYKGKAIFYSLGNFVFDQSRPETSRSVIVEATFGKEQITYKKLPVEIKRCKPFILTGCYFDVQAEI